MNLNRETISRRKAVTPMPSAAEKVKDGETKMCPLNLVAKRLLVMSAKSSFYKVVRQRLDWRASKSEWEVRNCPHLEEVGHPRREQ